MSETGEYPSDSSSSGGEPQGSGWPAEPAGEQGYEQTGYEQGGYQPEYQQAGYEQAGYEQGGYQPEYQQAGYEQAGYQPEYQQPGDAGVPGGAPQQVPCGEGPCPICYLQRQQSSACILMWGHESDHQCDHGDRYGVSGQDIPRDPIVPLCHDRCPTCAADPDDSKFKGECVRTLGHEGAHSYSCLHS